MNNNSDSKFPQSSDQIFQLIKKKPYTQMLDDVELTYSILSKKQQGFILANDRFLLLKGNQSISYSRSLFAGTPLPFRHYSSIPQPKAKFLLSDIETFTNEQEKLIIIFSSDNKNKWSLNCNSGQQQKIKWEFSCPSKVCALQWRRKLQVAIDNSQEFKRTKYQKINDLMYKEEKDNERISYHKRTIGMLGQSKISENSPSTYPSQMKTYSNNSIQMTNDSQNLPEVYFQKPEAASSRLREIQPFNNTTQKSTSSAPPPKPLSFLFKGPELAKVQELLLQNIKPQALISGSMREISISGKEKIKGELLAHRRNWIDELLAGQQQSELFLDFQVYIRKVADVIISQLYLPQQSKMFPSQNCYKDYATYSLEDIYIQLYFYSEENIEHKHDRYKEAVREFKNLDYLVQVTQNKGLLKVPFMALFQFKGFLGMAKSKISSDGVLKNKQYMNLIDRSHFKSDARINPDVLLDQNKCKIVLYQKRGSQPKLTYLSQKIYFVQKLMQFLPEENSLFDGQKRVSANLFRPELVQDEQLNELVFFDKINRATQKSMLLLKQKIKLLLEALQNHSEYFTNSKELSELLHLFGINIRHLGLLYSSTSQNWLKALLQAELAARCLKNFYRFDMQNCLLFHIDRIPPKEKQQERQRKRILSLLNLLLGNTQPTFRLWRNLNTYSKRHFGVSFWTQEFSNINMGFFIQAIQTHLKIVLSQNVLNKRIFFKSMNSLQDNDFAAFQLEVTGYNLDFTPTFYQINACIENQDQNRQSFIKLCTMISRVTKSGKPFLDLAQLQSINQKIKQFLLNFISPEANIELYDKIEEDPLPSKFMYESKLAQIKWYLMQHRLDYIQKPVSFIQSHLTKWLGSVHPINAQLNRLLAQYFVESQTQYSRALGYATDSLQMQISLFGDEEEPLWKDHFLLGKIHYLRQHYQEALPHLKRAQELVRVESLPQIQHYCQLMLTLSRCCFTLKYFKDAYTISKKLYQVIRQQKDNESLINMLQVVQLIKQLLQINQEHQSYYRFVQSDFGNMLTSFTDNPPLFVVAVQLAALPYLKSILQQSKNKAKLINLIEQISKIVQAENSSFVFLRSKTKDGEFPRKYLQYLREIDSIVEQIWSNQILARWMSFNNMSNKTLLSKIGSSQINRGFELLAYLTALFNLLGPGIIDCLFIMQK